MGTNRDEHPSTIPRARPAKQAERGDPVAPDAPALYNVGKRFNLGEPRR